ncbi:MAG: amidohydrolase family protein [Planctomycetota bacterium]
MQRTSQRRARRWLTAVSAALAIAAPLQAAAADSIVIRAGTVHPVEGGEPIANGGAIVVVDGKIVAVGKADAVEVPPGARTVDYGADAVIAPGLVAADSSYASTAAGDRTADPTLLAIDQFDPYAPLVSALRSGITTVYLAPARGRLIAGQGAVVKSGGGSEDDPEARILRKSAGLHGSISEEARRTPGYWEPPVPATVDVGLGVPKPQLPKTTMGAVLAIDELIAFAKGDASLAAEYGARTGPALATALEEGVVWRLGAESAREVRALLEVRERHGLPLVIDGASRAASAAEAIADAGVTVIAGPYFNNGRNFGKDQTANWPEYGAIARLVGEGVPVAIKAPSTLGAPDLRFGAALAMRGGLSAEDALAGITINAARALGVDDRVGSLAPGKDADMVVMTGDPLSLGSSVVATIVGGEVAWSTELANSKRGEKGGTSWAEASKAVVISVDELHVGDGTVHTPGEILLRDGKIAAVAPSVGRPAGATIVRAAAAMPGIVDAYGYLGIEGANRSFSTRLDLTRLLEPGDYADREVAKRGVTTVNLVSRNLGGITPTVAYKPASETFDGLVVDGVASVVMKWDEDIVSQSGQNVRQALAKAKEYVGKWQTYEKEMAAWTPPAEEKDDDKAKDDDEDDEEEDEEDDDGDDKKKKKKRKKGERDPAKPVTGVFEGTVQMAGDGPEGDARFRLHESEDGTIEGSMRASFYDELLSLTGSRDEYAITLDVDTPDGALVIELEQVYSNDPDFESSKKGDEEEDDDEKKDDDGDDDKKKDDEDEDEKIETFLRGEAKRADALVATIDVLQVSDVYKIVKRPTRLPEKKERKREPKGKPKEPSIDPDLEPLRRAMAGEAAILVSVSRDDQILRCVETFEAYGIRPVLYGADDSYKVADRIAGRVRGVLVPRNRMTQTVEGVTINRLAEVAAAGVPVAFFSQAEEGAAELGVIAAMAIARGLSPSTALRALTSDAAAMLCIDDRVGTLEPGKDGDVVLLDGSPLEVSSSIERVFVNGREVR